MRVVAERHVANHENDRIAAGGLYEVVDECAELRLGRSLLEQR
jgi:hypothetical protein